MEGFAPRRANLIVKRNLAPTWHSVGSKQICVIKLRQQVRMQKLQDAAVSCGHGFASPLHKNDIVKVWGANDRILT